MLPGTAHGTLTLSSNCRSHQQCSSEGVAWGGGEERGSVNNQVCLNAQSSRCVLVSILVNLTQARVVGEEETSAEKMAPSDLPIGKSVKHFLDW